MDDTPISRLVYQLTFSVKKLKSLYVVVPRTEPNPEFTYVLWDGMTSKRVLRISVCRTTLLKDKIKLSSVFAVLYLCQVVVYTSDQGKLSVLFARLLVFVVH